MGILDFLFGKKSERPGDDRHHPNVSFIGGIAEIKSLDFMGQYQKSHSGEWIICWSDSDRDNCRGGYRESGHGSYVLYNSVENKIYAKGRMERPTHGSVSDKGIFALEDWLFGGGLNGIFYAFTTAGETICKRRFEANLLNSAISDDGSMAICQTANNPKGNDGNLLTAFDLEMRTELFSIHPETGWANEYEFDDRVKQFIVVQRDIGKFTYDKAGNLLDKDQFETTRLTCKKYDVILFTAEDVLKRDTIPEEQVELVLKSILNARKLGADKDQGWKAMALKLQGIALETLGRDKEALEIYDETLSINPKIGVKRRADSLRKKISAWPSDHQDL